MFEEIKTQPFELRDYQVSGVRTALDHLLNGSHRDIPVIVAPTGAGKSLYVAKIASTLEKDVLVFQPSIELLEQNYAKFLAYGGNGTIFSASAGQKNIGEVTFATIGSVKDIADQFSHIRYVVIDECHLVSPKDDGMYMKFFDGLPNVKVIGLTATAFRNKRYSFGYSYTQLNLLPRERPRFFNDIIHVTQIKELYDKGFLCPVKYIALSWDNGVLKVNSTGGEYTDESIKEALDIQKINQRIPDIIKQSIEKGRKSRLVFVHSVADAEYLSSIVPNSSFVSAKTSKSDRKKIIEKFKCGEITTLFNVSTLTTGFDYPPLDTIIIARPTMSLALYMQIIGRGVRISEGKEYCALVDMCGNIDMFGKLEDIIYTKDRKGMWILKSGEKLLSGVPLN